MAGTITNSTDWNTFKSILASGGQITFAPGTNLRYNPNTHAQVDIGSGAVIIGNNATVTIQCGGTAYLNPDGQWAEYWVGAGCTINDLKLVGRQAFWVRGANITFNHCIVDQRSEQAEIYNALDGMYACFLINYSNANNVKFNDCEAWYADHMGYAVWGTTFDISGLEWNRCKAMHCGSGRENQGNNPWGRGWDFLEDFGTVRFTATDCCAYDCLQSGFYNEGDYDGRNSHAVGTLIRCHAENNGMRIAQAAIENRNLIGTIPWPNGVKSGSPDVYGDGYYLSGSMTLVNCTSKNNIVALSLDRVNVNGFQDEGSWIGAQVTQCTLDNVTFAKPKYHALAWWNAFGGGNIRIIDPPSGRAPVLSSWFAISGQRNIHPASYAKIYVDHANIVSTKYSNGGYLLLKNFANARWVGYSGNSPSNALNIVVNKTEYNTPSTCVKTNKGGSGNTSNVNVSYNGSLTYTPTSGCGTVVEPGPICVEGTVDCANKKICVSVNGNSAWQDIADTDARYTSKCPDEYCPPGSTEVICVGKTEYKCQNGRRVATGNTCAGDTLAPYNGNLPVLKKGSMTQIYARDFALGGQGKAYNDNSATNEGNSNYRTDGGSVDLVDWGWYPERMKEPDANKVVVGYTSAGEWLKYPVSVVDNGTYQVTFRASTTATDAKIIISVDGDQKTTVNIPSTGKYETFGSSTGNVIVPYIGGGCAVTLEFVGDMNLLWFGMTWVSADGAKTDPTIPPIPVSSFTVSTRYPVVNTEIQFTDTSTNSPTGWLWDFGDGSYSTEQNPKHTYTTANTYNVMLVARNAAGSSISPFIVITVSAVLAPPVASFVASSYRCKTGQVVQFTDTSTNSPTAWLWNFGDGLAQSTEQNPTRSFGSAGTYSITLKATNDAGFDFSDQANIVVSALIPTVTFSGTPTSGTAPLTVHFTGTATATGSWSWDFGDGATSNEQNPTHTYTNVGVYTVTATVSADGNVGNATKRGYIIVSELKTVEDIPGKPGFTEMRQTPYNIYVIRNEYGYICKIDAIGYDTGGEGNAYHNVENGAANTYRRGTDTIELYDDAIVTSTDEWVEYTITVSGSAYYYFKLMTKNNDPSARITMSTVDVNGKVISTLFNIPVPVTGDKFVEFFAKTETLNKFLLSMTEFTTLRLTFTGEFMYKSMQIMSSDTVENKIVSRSSITPMPDLLTLPFTIHAWQFDEGGPGISYMDRTEERFARKAIRDSDVDIITVGRENGTETLINGTMKGEWVQYTIRNGTGADYTDIKIDIECSTTNPLSMLQIVFLNEKDEKTYDIYKKFINSYVFNPPVVASFTEVQVITLTVRIYGGKNAMRVYFDDNITLGKMVFRPNS